MNKYEKAEEKKKREAEEKRRYLEGIKRFQKVGVTVLVDLLRYLKILRKRQKQGDWQRAVREKRR